MSGDASPADGQPDRHGRPRLSSAGAPPGGPSTPQIISEASELLRPLLREPAKAPEAAAQIVAVVETHNGPLPHPKILAGYDEIVPGAARALLDMAAAEQRHRHRMERRETAYPYLALLLGSAALLSCVAGCVFLAHAGFERVSIALVGAPLVVAVGWVLNSRLRSKPF